MKVDLANFKYIKQDEAERLGIAIDRELLNICKNGQLIYSHWYYDELTSNGRYIFLDVTDKFSNYLFERVRFVDDLRLSDIFQLVQNNINFIEPIIGNYCREISKAGLIDIKPYSNQYDEEEIEYLEFYRYLNIEKYYQEPPSDKRVIELNDGFHGVGFELQADYNYHSKGSRINRALDFSKINELSDTPIKINPDMPLYDYDVVGGPKEVFSVYEPKLLDVINEIFYELSWYGGPIDDKE